MVGRQPDAVAVDEFQVVESELRRERTAQTRQLDVPGSEPVRQPLDPRPAGVRVAGNPDAAEQRREQQNRCCENPRRYFGGTAH